MRKLLITGGSGFIGSVLVNKLYNTDDYDITVQRDERVGDGAVRGL